MAISVLCPRCSEPMQVNEQQLGGAFRCSKCSQTFNVRLRTLVAGETAPPRGLLARLRGMFQSLSPAGQESAPATPEGAKPGNEAFLDLDGTGVMPESGASAGTAETPPSTPTTRLDIGGATSVGRVRSRNEDSYLIQQLSWSNQDRRHDLALVVVADGMGGYAGGDHASGLVIQSVNAVLMPLLQAALQGSDLPSSIAAVVTEAIKNANQVIFQKAQADLALRGMGATVVVVLIRDGEVTIGHVGDCRVYHLGGSGLTQVTRDQTLVARLVEWGQLSPEEAQTHPARNEVLQAVGRHPEVEPADYQISLKSGEWLVVACDGLHGHVDKNSLASALWSATAAAPLACRLVDMANQGGGSDNCTVVAIRCY